MWFLARIYVPLCGGVLVGMLLSSIFGWWQRRSPTHPPRQLQIPNLLGRFLYWLGVPISLIHFLRQADLSGGVWLAPVMAWVAFAIALVCAWGWLHLWPQSWPESTQGTFLIAAMVGNTGYIGYPVILLLPQLGTAYFGWAVFYDLLGTVLGAYGLGAMIGTYFGQGIGKTRSRPVWRQSLSVLFKSPTLAAFGVGLVLRSVSFPGWLDTLLQGIAWSMVMLSLVLMGMRLQQLHSATKMRPALMSATIRMVIAPFLLGCLLTVLGITGAPRLVIVLQAGMPSAFATLVLAETFDLDRDLAVTCLGLSSTLLLVTLPLWLWGFSV